MWASLTAMGGAVAMTPNLPVELHSVTIANSPTRTCTSLHMDVVSVSHNKSAHTTITHVHTEVGSLKEA